MSGKVLKGIGNVWYQTEIRVPAKKRGVHKITSLIEKLPFLSQIKVGTCHVLIKHTSASLSLNECWDDSVRDDMETVLNRIVPQNTTYTHTLEGADDMPAHAKCSLMGASITLPVQQGSLVVGQWQGVWLLEHRDRASPRTLVITVNGCEE